MFTNRNAGDENMKVNSDFVPFNTQRYLSEYWPPESSTSIAWQDNMQLMSGYQKSALAISKYCPEKLLRVLDIGTGPALAPLLGIITIVGEIQTSDFDMSNRRIITDLPVEYWRCYAANLGLILENPQDCVEKTLRRLDELRNQRPPIFVDLSAENIFTSPVSAESFDLVTMNFCADSITKDEENYFRYLKKVLAYVRDGGMLSMSALVDSDYWMIGEEKHPSPRLSEESIVRFLTENNLNIIEVTRSERLPGQTYDGGWVVITAIR